MIYLTSDLHFCHNKDFIYQPRGFPSIEEHNETIIKNCNSLVTPEDDLYILGDLMLMDNEKGLECIKRLNGKKHFIIGNHDSKNRIKIYEENGLINEGNAATIKYRKYNFYLSHYPTITSNGEIKSLHQVTCNLFGHTHSKELFYEDIPYIYNVALDAHNCFPVSLDTIIDDMKDFMNKTNCTLIIK